MNRTHKAQAPWHDYEHRREELLKFPQRSAMEIGNDFHTWYAERTKRGSQAAQKDLAVEVLDHTYHEFLDLHGLHAAEAFLAAADPSKEK